MEELMDIEVRIRYVEDEDGCSLYLQVDGENAKSIRDPDKITLAITTIFTALLALCENWGVSLADFIKMSKEAAVSWYSDGVPMSLHPRNNLPS